MKRWRPSGQISLQKETTTRGNTRVGSVASNNVSAGISSRCDTVRITHAQSATDYVALGRDVESLVLSRAIHAHVHGRVFINGDRTIVFPPSPDSYKETLDE